MIKFPKKSPWFLSFRLHLHYKRISCNFGFPLQDLEAGCFGVKKKNLFQGLRVLIKLYLSDRSSRQIKSNLVSSLGFLVWMYFVESTDRGTTGGQNRRGRIYFSLTNHFLSQSQSCSTSTRMNQPTSPKLKRNPCPGCR